MKKIITQGITYVEPLDGSPDWYWGTNYANGDLYEAEELFRQGHSVRQNRLLFIHYPDGEVLQPVTAEAGQYFGRPLYHDGRLVILMVDFLKGEIRVLGCDPDTRQTAPVVTLPLSVAEDCYNLALAAEPLMLTRQSVDSRFQLLWPERRTFQVEDTESFYFRSGDKLHFNVWYDEPEYHEAVIVRSLDTGEVLERIAGGLLELPDGQKWLLV